MIVFLNKKNPLNDTFKGLNISDIIYETNPLEITIL